LFAAALGSQWAGVAADDVGPLYADLEPNRGVANLLRHGDLPQVAVLAAPRRLWLNRTGSRFTFTVEGYRQLSHAKAVRCSDISVAEFDAAIPGWVANTNGTAHTEAVADPAFGRARCPCRAGLLHHEIGSPGTVRPSSANTSGRTAN